MRLYRKVLMCTIIVVLGICLFGCKDKDEFKPSVKQQNSYKLYYVNSKREKIFDYLLSLDVNPDVLLEFCAISIELANRDLMKSLGLS